MRWASALVHVSLRFPLIAHVVGGTLAQEQLQKLLAGTTLFLVACHKWLGVWQAQGPIPQLWSRLANTLLVV